MSSLQDRFSRTLEYARISITDACNYRCIYCRPAPRVESGLRCCRERPVAAPAMTIPQIVEVASLLASFGIRRFRLTGGEPLLREDLVDLVALLASRLKPEDLSLTTNGEFLERLAAPLAGAGLHRINVSLDSLRRERFAHLTGGGDLDAVWRGIDAALRAGLQPVKLNVVLLAGVNEDEITDFIELARAEPLHVRFIALMDTGVDRDFVQRHLLDLAPLSTVIGGYGLQPVAVTGAGPARTFGSTGWRGSVGVIEFPRADFCGSCNRLRVSAQGRLRPCLHGPAEWDLLGVLERDGRERALALVEKAVAGKELRGRCGASAQEMVSLGG